MPARFAPARFVPARFAPVDVRAATEIGPYRFPSLVVTRTFSTVAGTR